MKRASLVLTLALSVAATVIPPGPRAFAAPANQAVANVEALTIDAEAVLDAWSGQPDILDLAARKLYDVLRTDRNYAKAYVQLCRLHIMAGYRYSDKFEPLALGTAEKAILKAIQLDPNHGDAYVVQGHLYTNLGRMDEAKEALWTAAKVGTKSPWLKLNWAAIFEIEGYYDRAADYYRDVAHSGTTNRKALSAAYAGLTGWNMMKGRFDEAESVHYEYVKINPTNAWGRGNFAALLVDYGLFERAIPHARAAIEIMDYPAARYTLASALYGGWAVRVMQEIEPHKAQSYFDEARDLRPDLVQLARESLAHPRWQVITKALIKQGLVDEATATGHPPRSR